MATGLSQPPHVTSLFPFTPDRVPSLQVHWVRGEAHRLDAPFSFWYPWPRLPGFGSTRQAYPKPPHRLAPFNAPPSIVFLYIRIAL